jgi:hypothetical protein
MPRSRKCATFPLILLAFLHLVGCSKDPAKPRVGALYVTVLDQVGAPVPGSRVTLTDEDEVRTTGTDGRVLFAEVRARLQSVAVEVEGLDPIASSVEVAENDTTRHSVDATLATGSLTLEIQEDWTGAAVEGVIVRVLRAFDRGELDEQVTSAIGRTSAVTLPAGSYIAETGILSDLERGTLEFDLAAGGAVTLTVTMERTRSWFQGDVDFDTTIHTSPGNDVGLLYAASLDGALSEALAPAPVQLPYSLKTDINGYLAVVTLGSVYTNHFGAVFSPMYDCTGGHARVQVPLLHGEMDSAWPINDVEVYGGVLLEVRCQREMVGVDYTEWQFWRWYQDANQDWQYELHDYHGEWPGGSTFDWTPPEVTAPEGVYYSWTIAELYGDGRSRFSYDYFMLVKPDPGSASSARTSRDHDERVQAARSSLLERAGGFLTARLQK